MKYYLFIVWWMVPVLSEAQDPLQFLQKALLANGPWEEIGAFQYRANRYNVNPWQSYDFDRPQAEQDLYECWFDRDSNRYRDHTIQHYPGGYVFDFISIGRDSMYYEYNVTRARTGRSLFQQGREQFTANYEGLLSYFPYYLLKEVLGSGDSLQLQRANQEVVIRRHSQQRVQELRLDAQTTLLHSISIMEGGKTDSWYYNGYVRIKGCLVPGKVKQVLSNSRVVTDRLVTFNISATITPMLFELPAEYRPLNIPATPLKAEEIEKDIFLVEKVDGDRNILFINLEDHIVLTEAPVSVGTVSAVLELIHRTLPGKPIKYVHLSHFHKDHIAGVRKLVEEGVAIICTASMEKPVRKMLGGMDASFVFFNGYKRISDDHHLIDLFEIPNSHAQGLSFMYFPKGSIIYEGDLLSVPEDTTITPAIQVYKEFYGFLKKRNLSYKRIIGHHGLSNITPEIFNKLMQLSVSLSKVTRLQSKG